MGRDPVPRSSTGDAGHRIYTRWFLQVYDPLVLGLYSNHVWGCRVRRLVDLYSENLRRRHLDVGPGTGYFLARARLPAELHLTLLDPSPDVLAHASRRLRALEPTAVRADARRPLPLPGEFDSAALSYVLHCLPGPQLAKAPAVRHVADVLTDDGVLFGATVLGEVRLHTAVGRAALRALNRQGIFDNRTDTEDGLRQLLAGAFSTVTIDVVGSVAVFSARSPRRTSDASASS